MCCTKPSNGRTNIQSTQWQRLRWGKACKQINVIGLIQFNFIFCLFFVFHHIVYSILRTMLTLPQVSKHWRRVFTVKRYSAICRDHVLAHKYEHFDSHQQNNITIYYTYTKQTNLSKMHIFWYLHVALGISADIRI